MDNYSKSVWPVSLWRNLLHSSSLQFVTQVSLSLAVQNNEPEQHCAGVSVCICACPVKHQCPDQQTMGGNVLRVTDRPFGRFRPSTADSPLPSSQGAVNCVHNPALCRTCILIRPQTIWGWTHCSVHRKRAIKWARSTFACHIVLLFNGFSIVCSLAEVQPALNHTWVFYPWSWMMSLGFQLQLEGVFVQLLFVVSDPSWWNSGRVSAVSNPTRMVSNQISFTR